MNCKPLKSYLRAHRKRLALTQGELALLLGCHGRRISRYERGDRRMTLEVVLACLIVFGAPAGALFAGDYRKIQQQVSARARLLLAKLRRRPDAPLARRKIRFLRRIISEADAS